MPSESESSMKTLGVTQTSTEVEVSVVMPCLNEAETLETCIHKALDFFARSRVSGEVVVADNGSTDGSVDIARRAGARVVHVEKKGYGNALMGGFEAAKGKYLIMGDADDSYDFQNLMPFIEKLRAGYDVVMGNRFRGGIKAGAMSWHHKYIGNPVLTGLLNLFFRSGIGDAHCGLRGLTREAFNGLRLRTTGMEFASEMVVKAAALGLKMTEVPTVLNPDGRSRPPHLRSFRDGWRHLRFLMLLAPKWALVIPGGVMGRRPHDAAVEHASDHRVPGDNDRVRGPDFRVAAGDRTTIAGASMGLPGAQPRARADRGRDGNSRWTRPNRVRCPRLVGPRVRPSGRRPHAAPGADWDDARRSWRANGVDVAILQHAGPAAQA